MKTNVIIKFAVVAMAAFGAYAFSGNTNANDLYINQNSNCTNITADCDLDGIYTCRVKTPEDQVFPVWGDSGCKIEIKHSDLEPIGMMYN